MTQPCSVDLVEEVKALKKTPNLESSLEWKVVWAALVGLTQECGDEIVRLQEQTAQETAEKDAYISSLKAIIDVQDGEIVALRADVERLRMGT